MYAYKIHRYHIYFKSVVEYFYKSRYKVDIQGVGVVRRNRKKLC